MSFKPQQLDGLSTLLHCLTWISDWLFGNDLLLNANTTETMIVVVPPELYLEISQALASLRSAAKSNVHNLGGILDFSLDFDLNLLSCDMNSLTELEK